MLTVSGCDASVRVAFPRGGRGQRCCSVRVRSWVSHLGPRTAMVRGFPLVLMLAGLPRQTRNAARRLKSSTPPGRLPRYPPSVELAGDPTYFFSRCSGRCQFTGRKVVHALWVEHGRCVALSAVRPWCLRLGAARNAGLRLSASERARRISVRIRRRIGSARAQRFFGRILTANAMNALRCLR